MVYDMAYDFLEYDFDKNFEFAGVQELSDQIQDLKLFDCIESSNSEFNDIVPLNCYILYAEELKSSLSLTEKAERVTIIARKFVTAMPSMLEVCNSYKKHICTQFCRMLHKKLIDKIDIIQKNDKNYAFFDGISCERIYNVDLIDNDCFNKIYFQWSRALGDDEPFFAIIFECEFLKSLESDENDLDIFENECSLSYYDFLYDNFNNMDLTRHYADDAVQLYKKIVILFEKYHKSDE